MVGRAHPATVASNSPPTPSAPRISSGGRWAIGCAGALLIHITPLIDTGVGAILTSRTGELLQLRGGLIFGLCGG